MLSLFSGSRGPHRTELPSPCRRKFYISLHTLPYNFWPSVRNCKAKIKCVICGEGHLHKGCPNREKSNQNVLIAKDHMLLTIKGVQLIKNRYSINICGGQPKKLCLHFKANFRPASQPKGDTFSFTANQLVKFVATVAIQIAQPQVCYTNAPKDTVDKKSSLCPRVSKAAKSQLGISISGSALFDDIGSVRAQHSLPPKFQSSYLNLSISLLPPNHQP